MSSDEKKLNAVKDALWKLAYFKSKDNPVTVLNAYGCDLHLGSEYIDESNYDELDGWGPEHTMFIGLMNEDCNLTVEGVKELKKYVDAWLTKYGDKNEQV